MGQFLSFKGLDSIPRDSKGKVFIDRDGVLFRYILDYLRNQSVILPENFHEKARLRAEAEFFQLDGLLKYLDSKLEFGSVFEKKKQQQRIRQRN